MADRDLRSVPEGVNLDPPSEYDTSPEALPPHFPSEYDNGPEALQTPEPADGLRDNQQGLNIGSEQPKGKIWGMKRKSFMIALGVLILIIAVAAGVGGGVGGTSAKSNTHKGASESIRSYAPQNCKTSSWLVKGANMETKQPIANIHWWKPPASNRSSICLFVSRSYTHP